MRDGGFCLSIPGGRGTSLVGRCLHRGTSLPFVWFCSGACSWVWLLGWPTVLPPGLRGAAKCLQWFQCASLDRDCGGQAAWSCRIKSCRKRWQGKAHLWKKRSQIKQTGKEIALLAAKEIVCQTYYFSAESISARFLNPLCPSTPFATPHPHSPLPPPPPPLSKFE